MSEMSVGELKQYIQDMEKEHGNIDNLPFLTAVEGWKQEISINQMEMYVNDESGYRALVLNVDPERLQN